MGELDTTVINPNAFRTIQQGLNEATRAFEDQRIGFMNQMAEAIIDNGNITTRVEEFALAIHGLSNYRSNFARIGGKLDPTESDETTVLYDTIEQSVDDYTNQIMSTGGQYPTFAMQPFSLKYPLEDGGATWSPQPLRFAVSTFIDYGNYAGEKAYCGDILLPVLALDDDTEEPQQMAIHVARFQRNAKRTEVEVPYVQDFRKVWRVGKAAVVRGRIQDYSTSLEQDTAFLRQLDSTTTILTRASKQIVPSDWDNVLKQVPLTGGGD